MRDSRDWQRENSRGLHAKQRSTRSSSRYSEVGEWRTAATSNKSLEALYTYLSLHYEYEDDPSVLCYLLLPQCGKLAL